MNESVLSTQLGQSLHSVVDTENIAVFAQILLPCGGQILRGPEFGKNGEGACITGCAPVFFRGQEEIIFSV